MRGVVDVTGPEIAFTIGTRAALGIGFGLLLADRISSGEARRVAGWTLLTVGAVGATILTAELFGRPRPLHIAFGPEPGGGVSEPRDWVSRERMKVGD